jgi:hypothetical protein
VTTSSFRLVLATGLLGLQFTVHAAPPAPAAFTFDTTPRAGQHQRQVMDMQMTMSTRMEAGPEASDEQRAKIAQAAEQMAKMGSMKMNMRMEQTLRVDKADAQGWLPLMVSVTTKGGDIEVAGNKMPMPQDKLRDISVSARFNPKDFAFEMQQVQGAGDANEFMRKQGTGMVNEALQLSKTLSQRELKIGESVEVPLNMALPIPIPGGGGQMDSKVRYTLARVERGVAHFDLSMDMQISANTPVPAKPASAADAASAPATTPQSLHMQLSGTGKGSSSLRLADRLPLSSQMTMDMKMDMRLPDNGLMHMDMQMLMQSKGESLAKPAAKKKS